MAGPVGVLGGTFDPIHVAHLALAYAARDAVGLAEVRFIPSARPPHRDAPAAAAAHRLAMVEAAIAGTAGFVADARELHRLTPSWTIDTLTSLRAEVGTDRPLVLLMGEDAFALLHTWHRWTELTATAHLVVARRPDAAPLQARLTAPVAALLERAETPDPDALRTTAAGRIWRLALPPMPVAATDIRAALARGERPRDLLPAAVLDYIDRHHLYASPHDRAPRR